MSLKFATTLTGSALFLLSATICSASATELKMSGAAAVAGSIVMPNRAAIETETGLTLDVTANGDGNGIKDLFAGKVDAAMIAAPIKITEASLNKSNPGSVSVDGFEVAPVGAISIKFIVNAANPVKSLTEAQLKDIFTGKIASWKDVGGDDQPIVVVAEAPGFGTRSNIVASLLGGTEITDKARIVLGLAPVAQAVAGAPNAIGYGNGNTIKEGAAIVPGTTVKQVLGVATKGAPNADMAKLIASMAKFGASVN
jgi:phosphate transport system substrate-binding protein